MLLTPFSARLIEVVVWGLGELSSERAYIQRKLVFLSSSAFAAMVAGLRAMEKGVSVQRQIQFQRAAEEDEGGKGRERDSEVVEAAAGSGEERISLEVAGMALPSEVIERILSLLPPRCIFKLRSVSKKWNLTLSSHAFLKTCVQESLGQPMLFTFTDHWSRKVAAWSSKTMKWSEFSLAFIPTLTAVKASAGGLVLCSNLVGNPNGFSEDGIVVCNPATKAWTQLPQPSSSPSTPASAMAIKIVQNSGGLGFHVIRSISHPGDHGGNHFSLLEAYSSDTRMWTIVGKIRHCELVSILWCRDTLYCLNTSRPHMLVSSRLDNCQWRRFDLPPVRVDHPRLIEWKGNVLLTGVCANTNKFNVWILNPITLEWTAIARGMNAYVMDTGDKRARLTTVGCGDYIIFIGGLAVKYMNMLALHIPTKKWGFLPACPFSEREDGIGSPSFCSCNPSFSTPF